MIVHDPSKLSVEQILEIVDDRGFDAKLLSSCIRVAEQSIVIRLVLLKFF